MAVTELPGVVDAAWLAEHLGEDDLVVGDVRGPNAHMRGHIPGSRPLVLGSPPPGADEPAVAELAEEVTLRLRRHGITGNERLVLVDRGDGVGAMPAAQMAELAGHPSVAILLGGTEYGLADIAYVPWLLRARDMLGVELDGFPALSDWLARLEQRPAVAAETELVAAL